MLKSFLVIIVIAFCLLTVNITASNLNIAYAKKGHSDSSSGKSSGGSSGGHDNSKKSTSSSLSSPSSDNAGGDTTTTIHHKHHKSDTASTTTTSPSNPSSIQGSPQGAPVSQTPSLTPPPNPTTTTPPLDQTPTTITTPGLLRTTTSPPPPCDPTKEVCPTPVTPPMPQPQKCERNDSGAVTDLDKDLKTLDCDHDAIHPPPVSQCPDGSAAYAQGKCPLSHPIRCERADSNAKVDADKDLKTRDCDTGDANEHHATTTIVRVINRGGSSSSSGSSNNVVVLPSKPTDFANKDPSTLTVDFVHASGPDARGNYYVKGEVMSTTPALNNLKITAHWFDSSNKLIGVTFAYADELALNFGDRSTFSVLANGHNDLTGIPKSVELSYDWQ